MVTSVVRIGIVGCGMAARIHLDRFLAPDGVSIAGCADRDLRAARALADRASLHTGAGPAATPAPAFADHRELLPQVAPDVLSILAPQLSHDRLTMNARQAGCRVDYVGTQGRLRATDQTLEEERLDVPRREVALPAPTETIEGNFVAAIASESRLCCPADEALDTVRLLDAIARSAATGQIVRLI